MNESIDVDHPKVSTSLLPMYNEEVGCVAGYMRKKPFKQSTGYWTRVSKWPRRWFWVNLDLHGSENYQLHYIKQGAHTQHKIQRVYHLVNGQLERISDTSFILHIPNAEDLYLQCDSLSETNRWLATLAQLIHAANLRAESLSSAYVANMPSFDSLGSQSHSQSWWESMDKSNSLDRLNHSVDTVIPFAADGEEFSSDDTTPMTNSGRGNNSVDSLTYQAIDKPDSELMSNTQELNSTQLNVPLVPNTHDREFFDQLQSLLPMKSDSDIDSDDNIAQTLHDITSAVAPVTEQIQTLSHNVSTMLDSVVQETLDEVANEQQPATIQDSHVSFDPSLENPIVESLEEQQQSSPITLPILSPSIIYGSHSEPSNDQCQEVEEDADERHMHEPAPFVKEDADERHMHEPAPFVEEDADERHMHEPAPFVIPPSKANEKAQRWICYDDTCMQVDDTEQDVSSVGNNLLFEGAIRLKPCVIVDTNVPENDPPIPDQRPVSDVIFLENCSSTEVQPGEELIVTPSMDGLESNFQLANTLERNSGQVSLCDVASVGASDTMQNESADEKLVDSSDFSTETVEGSHPSMENPSEMYSEWESNLLDDMPELIQAYVPDDSLSGATNQMEKLINLQAMLWLGPLVPVVGFVGLWMLFAVSYFLLSIIVMWRLLRAGCVEVYKCLNQIQMQCRKWIIKGLERLHLTKNKEHEMQGVHPDIGSSVTDGLEASWLSSEL